VLHHIGPDRDGTILVHISEDAMTAVIDLYPHVGGGKPLELDGVEYALLNAGVTSGLDREAIFQGIHKAETGGDTVKGVIAAHGTPAADTTPRRFSLFFQPAAPHSAGEVKVDYREFSVFPVVRKNDVIAKPEPRQEGHKGSTVTGKELPFKDASDEELEAGDNVAVLGNGDYVARDDGRVIPEKGRIRVESALLIDRDVDFSTGNIRFPKNVAVGGNVLDEFIVETNGNISIKGLVGAAAVSAKGSVEILGGFSGKGKGSVRAGGEVHIAYVDNGRVTCIGNLTVANEIVNSIVRANGKISCVGKKGAIIGGSVSARDGVECSTAGSERAHETRIETGVDIMVDSRLRKAEGLMAILTERVTAVDYALEEAKKYSRESPGLAKERRELMKKLNDLAVEREKLKAAHYAAPEAAVHVKSRVFSGVVISICGVEKAVAQTMGPTVFSLDSTKTHVVTDRQAQPGKPA
jgi:uncharacterized protein (DUF342 family)